MPDVIYAIAWYIHADDYEACHRVKRKRGEPVVGYDLWRKQAEAFERKSTEIGYPIQRVVIDMDKIRAWCAERGYDLDDQAINEYTNLVANLAGLGEVHRPIGH